MTEYIEREELLQKVKDEKPYNWSDDERGAQECWDWDFFISIIESQPKADVAEIKHGQWIEDIMEAPNPFDNGETTIDVNIVRCSVCGECFEKVAYHRNYCENCGSMMVGDNDENATF